MLTVKSFLLTQARLPIATLLLPVVSFTCIVTNRYVIVTVSVYPPSGSLDHLGLGLYTAWPSEEALEHYLPEAWGSSCCKISCYHLLT